MSLCVPKENDELEVYCSAQAPSFTQMEISKVLNVPSNKINVHIKRMGEYCLLPAYIIGQFEVSYVLLKVGYKLKTYGGNIAQFKSHF